mmetsp:Transcript_110252/g.355550  ORF Transcript_110252/g.355550 Transcript_110252/m.355550 type:complete len:314 (-) Transcript_110252:694-1635(-)
MIQHCQGGDACQVRLRVRLAASEADGCMFRREAHDEVGGRKRVSVPENPDQTKKRLSEHRPLRKHLAHLWWSSSLRVEVGQARGRPVRAELPIVVVDGDAYGMQEDEDKRLWQNLGEHYTVVLPTEALEEEIDPIDSPCGQRELIDASAAVARQQEVALNVAHQKPQPREHNHREELDIRSLDDWHDGTRQQASHLLGERLEALRKDFRDEPHDAPHAAQDDGPYAFMAQVRLEGRNETRAVVRRTGEESDAEEAHTRHDDRPADKDRNKTTVFMIINNVPLVEHKATSAQAKSCADCSLQQRLPESLSSVAE